MSEIVVIPSDYAGQKSITPISLKVTDDYGNRIAPELICGVEQSHRALCRLSIAMLRDVERVSDLAQSAVNRVWKRQGNQLGARSPKGLIYGAARLIARTWRWDEFERSQQVDPLFAADAIEFPGTADMETEYNRRMDTQRLIESMRKRMSAEEQHMLNLYLTGFQYEEISKIFGKPRGGIFSMFVQRARGSRSVNVAR